MKTTLPLVIDSFQEEHVQEELKTFLVALHMKAAFHSGSSAKDQQLQVYHGASTHEKGLRAIHLLFQVVDGADDIFARRPKMT